MKESFDELYGIMRLDRRNSPWSKKDTMENRCKELASEVEEVKLAISSNDVQNLKEELGDVLLDLLFLLVIAEEKGMFTAKEVIDGPIAKLKHRKPWIFSGEKLTVEEETKRWHELKAQEKAGKKK